MKRASFTGTIPMRNPISRGPSSRLPRLGVALLIPLVMFAPAVLGEHHAILAGEVLYNGIELPDSWPPRREVSGDEPMPVPYLDEPPAVIPIDVGRQLFVDDFLIESTTLKRVFHQPQYHSASPVLVPDKPWESGRWAMAFSDGVWYDPEDSLFKMWYYAGSDKTCLAFSRDGIRWEKPEFDVVPGTNIVMRHVRRDSSTVWLDLGESDPKRRYKALIFTKEPRRRGLDLHVSSDGIHWSGPVAHSKNIGDRTTFFYNPFRKVWVYSLRVGMGKLGRPRSRVYREHPDVVAGFDWREKDGLYEQHTDLFPWTASDRLDPRHPNPEYAAARPDLYNLDAAAYESVLLGLFSICQGPKNEECKRLGIPKRNQVFVGFSRDGFHWDRPDRRPFLKANEEEGAWNWGNVQSVGGCCLIVGDELYFYASGRAPEAQGGHKTTGLATLRRDGFASMGAETKPGTLTTRPVRFSGKHLFVNADVSGGALRVAVLDSDGNVIEPFTAENCVPVRGDSTRACVKWKTPANPTSLSSLTSLSGRPVRFRFYLSEGALYSFWVTPDPAGASRGFVAAGGPGLTGIRD